jgi:hypothetical protein
MVQLDKKIRGLDYETMLELILSSGERTEQNLCSMCYNLAYCLQCSGLNSLVQSVWKLGSRPTETS